MDSKRVKRKERGVLAIVLLGGLLRLGSVFRVPFSGDFQKHWQIAAEIVEGKIWPWLGPAAHINPDLKMGPIYYYWHALFYWLGQGRHPLTNLAFVILNTLGIYLLFQALKKWFDLEISLLAVFLYSFSRYAIEVNSFAWNPYFLPPVHILALYGLSLWPALVGYLLFGLALGLAVQFHPSSWTLLPLVIFLIYRKRKGLEYRKLFLSAGIFILTLLPYLIGIGQNAWAFFGAVFSAFNPQINEQCNFVYWLFHHKQGGRCFYFFRNPLLALRFFSLSWLGTESLMIAPLILAVLAYFVFKVKTKEKIFWLLWLFVPLPFFIFYTMSIHFHYYLLYFPLLFIILAVLVTSLKSKKILSKFGIKIFLGLYFLVNMISFVQLFKK